jgi:hypothetical protein
MSVLGTVPIYWGDGDHLKKLLPDPKAAIFVSDYPNATALVDYLKYLMTNETAYEEYRAWRNVFSYEKHIGNKPLLQLSWPCRVCQWAVEKARQEAAAGTREINAIKRAEKCHRKHGDVSSLEGKAVKVKTGKAVYLIQNSTRLIIPDVATFSSMGLDTSKVITITDDELNKIPPGSKLENRGNPFE